MSSIEKLSIRGIRSFSPNREEIIEFYHPLTVILGDNGCGKTTIIECLKVSCTGALPPGARSGQSFIHDPKIAGTKEVKASIRLRYRNSAGQPMVVQRTFQLVQTKTKATFKALDGVVRIQNNLGEKVSMSHKCAELDRHIPETLGVSKAILESVIFCHQEESNWPLQEGAVLKKRFDDIFESARYTKALDAIKKLRKARFSDTKDFKRDLEILSYKMKAASEIRDNIEATEEKLRRVRDEAAALNEKVDQEEGTLEAMERQRAEIQTLYSALERADLEVSQKEDSIKRAYDNIEQMMSDSDEELEALLSNYDEIIGEHRKAFRSLQEQESQLIAEKNTAQEEYSKLCISKGNVEAKIEAQQALISELLEQGAKLGAKYSFHTQPISSQDDDIKRFASKFKHVVDEKKEALSRLESEQQKAEDRLTCEVSELNSKVLHARQQVKVKQKEVNNLNVEKRKIAAKIKDLTAHGFPSEREVSAFETRIVEAENALQAFKGKNDLLALKNEIQDGNRKMNDLTFEIDQLDEKIKVLRLHEREHIALEAKRLEHRSKVEEFQSKLAEKSGEYQSLLDHTELTNANLADAARKAADIVSQRRRACDEKKKEQALAEQKLQENMAASKHTEKALSSLRLEKNELERNQVGELRKVIEDVSPGEELKNAEHVLQKVEKAYLDAKDKTLRCKNTITFLSIFKTKGEKEHCCPLCQRGMNEEEQMLFIKAINEKTDDKKVKEKIKKAETQESNAYKKWKAVEKFMPSWRKWMLLEKQIPEKSNELDEIYVTQRTLQADVKDKKSALELAQKMLEDAQKARQELSVLAEVMEDLERSDTRLADQEERIRSMETEMLGANAPSLTEVQSQKDRKQADIQELNRQIQRKQSELQRVQEMQQQLQNDLHKKKQEKLKLDQARMDYNAATEEQNTLRDADAKLREEMTDVENEIPNMERELKAKNEERQHQRELGGQQVRELRAQVQQCQQDLRSFEEKRRKVEEEMQLDLDNQLQRLSHEIAKTKQKQTTASQALEEITPQLMSARQNLDQQETFKRHIRDNLEYRKMKRDLDVLRGDVDTIRQKIDSKPNLDDITKRVKACKAKVSSARDERATLVGREQQLNDQIRDYKVQLRSSDFRNIEERHRQKLIQCETTTMAVADLDKYYKALDQSLLQYHQKKVEEINSIIRSLWQITYKGQDIDTIELVSGEEAESSGTKANRSYNYRVVMKKGATMIDMRGRCSAGQKVLAALVIRLALAETFCLNCGILALDEPTTNLDTVNKYGLAQAITDILNARSSQQNFQLICITHDEEFVQMLNRTQMMDGTSPEYYWRVSREDMGNNRFCSKIERHEWRDGI